MQEEQEDLQGKEGRKEEGVSIFTFFICMYSVCICFSLCCVKLWLNRTDPFAKKDWYDIKAPNVFEQKNVGKTLVSRTQGTKVYLYIFRIFRLICVCCFYLFESI